MISGGSDMGGGWRGGGSMGSRGSSSWRGGDEFAELDPDAKLYDQNVVRRMLPYLGPHRGTALRGHLSRAGYVVCNYGWATPNKNCNRRRHCRKRHTHAGICGSLLST